MKVLHSLCQQIWKTQQWPQDWTEPDSGSRMGRAHECVTGHRDVRPSERSGLIRLTAVQEVNATERQAGREFDVAEGVRRKRGVC